MTETLVSMDKSCKERVPYFVDPPSVPASNSKAIVLYEDDILELARIVYYFGYLFPPAIGIAYQTLKSAQSSHASVVRDCITEPRIALSRMERVLLDNGFDIASLK